MNRLRGALCLSIGKPSWDLWLNVFGCALFVPAFVLGSRHGIAGVALGFTLASVVEAPVVLVVMSRALATSVLELVRPLASVAWSTALMAAGAAGTGWLLQESVGPAVQLTAMVVVGGGLYVLCLRLLAPELVAGLVRDLARRVR